MGCCGSGGALGPLASAAAPVDTSDWVLLQYNGSAESPIQFTSHETGNTYRVSKTRLRQIPVRPVDVAYLLDRGFTLVDVEIVNDDNKADSNKQVTVEDDQDNGGSDSSNAETGGDNEEVAQPSTKRSKK